MWQYINVQGIHFPLHDCLTLFVVLAFSASWVEMHDPDDSTKKKGENRQQVCFWRGEDK